MAEDWVNVSNFTRKKKEKREKREKEEKDKKKDDITDIQKNNTESFEEEIYFLSDILNKDDGCMRCLNGSCKINTHVKNFPPEMCYFVQNPIE